MEIEFFSRTKKEAAIKAIEEIMSTASTCLQIEMCYVTDYGVKLLNRQKEKLLRPGSFIVVSDDPTNDLEGLNMLAELRPDSVEIKGSGRTLTQTAPKFDSFSRY